MSHYGWDIQGKFLDYRVKPIKIKFASVKLGNVVTVIEYLLQEKRWMLIQMFLL